MESAIFNRLMNKIVFGKRKVKFILTVKRLPDVQPHGKDFAKQSLFVKNIWGCTGFDCNRKEG